ncbi:hypothetical protein [Haloarchaeobius sp. HRN-SO-5]|uniref:hypothetical protein n=1 Tax=Haloarchaeobius sp. HRN-SO-5 TaxID=3446118 RepID=UPI003EBF101D
MSRVERHVERLLAALAYPLTTAGRTLAVALFSVLTYVFLVLSSFPEYSAQMLGAGATYLDDAVLALTANTYSTIGELGLGLVVVYSLVTGVALTNALGRLGQVGPSGTRGLASAVPGLLASGCASCGAGVLGLLGFAGAMATLPFHGNLLRAGGLVLLLGYLARAGDPRYCDVGPASE